MTDILECLGTDLTAFFSEKGQQKLVFTEDDMSVKEGEGSAIKWLVPSAQKNRMEPILVELAPGAQTEEQDPHEGEEFGYVLQGQVLVVLGDKRVKARKAESFCFEPTAPHFLINTGKTVCRVLWVATPPILLAQGPLITTDEVYGHGREYPLDRAERRQQGF